MAEPQPAPAPDLRELLPPAAYEHLVAELTRYAKRAKAGRTVPESVLVGLILNKRTGRVVAVDVPRRVGE